MSNSVDAMTKTMEVMASSSEKQAQSIAKLVKTVEALKEQLGKNSKDSSKPSDPETIELYKAREIKQDTLFVKCISSLQKNEQSYNKNQ